MSEHEKQASLNWKIESLSLEDRSSGQRLRLASFTLIELMIVVAVIGLIAGIVLAAAGGVQKKAARDQTIAEIKTMTVALERYKTDQGTYPQTNRSTLALYRFLTNYMTFATNRLSGTGNDRTYLDPYGYAYWYECPAQGTAGSLMAGSPESYRVWSFGRDGKENTRDDIRSSD